MTKLAITRKLKIAIRSKRGGRTSGSDAAESGCHARLALQPIRELLLQIRCRCSHRQQSIQLMVVVLGNRRRRPAADFPDEKIQILLAHSCAGYARRWSLNPWESGPLWPTFRFVTIE